MGGVIVVSLGDSDAGANKDAPHPVLGDFLSLLSAAFYAAYVTLIRQKLPDEDDKAEGHVSMAQFLGFLGLFNFIIFFPVALILAFSKLGLFNTLTGKQFGLIVGKGIIISLLLHYSCFFLGYVNSLLLLLAMLFLLTTYINIQVY